MARLPVPGGDVDAWAAILNEYLLVTHNSDGTQKNATINLPDLHTSNLPTDPPVKTPILSHDGTTLRWQTSIEINVRDYGATGDGVTDDTAAVQAAIDSAGSGLVVFPSGVFMIRGVKIRNKGTAIRGDGRFGTRIKRLSGTEPLLDMSGSGTEIGHLRYDTIANFQIDGNNMPGVLVRSYYADSCVYRELSFVNCKGLALDFVEVWDTRFENCTWEHCGSVDEPATLFRNSMPPGTFGYSKDNTNQIYFIACRWEGWHNGALRLDGAANGSTALLNGIFLVSCKMESRVAAGPAFQVLSNTTVIFVNQLYIAMMGKHPAVTRPLDAIVDHASHLFMTNVYVQWGVATGLANSVVHVVKSAPHMYHELGTFYPTESPAKATVWVEPEAKDVTFSSLWTNRGKDGTGNFSKLLGSNPIDGLAIPLKDPGTFRIVNENGDVNKDLLKVDNNAIRPALHLLNGLDAVGFSDNYTTEKWRIIGGSGAARFAGKKFQIEGTKGYVGINATPLTGVAMLVRAAADGDRGLAIVRSSSTTTSRLMEFQDENHDVQGMAIDSHGRPVAVGTPPRVTAADQVSYANPNPQVRDLAGSVVAAVRPSPTAPGAVAVIMFSRAHAQPPLFIALADHSAKPGDLYVSSRDANGFTVSTRSALPGGTILNFDYAVIA